MDRIKKFIDEHLYHILIALLGVIGLLIGGLVVANNSPHNVSETLPQPTAAKTNSEQAKPPVKSSSIQEEAKETEQLYVDIKGAVKRPGVYQITKEMRVQDAVNLAGGLTKSADKKQINLAGKLTDQQVVYVPLRGEIKGNALEQGITPQTPQTGSEDNANGETASSSASSTTTDSNNAKINLNTADKSKLQELTGIGEKKAEQIIAYRETTGQFKQIEDLKNVSGFGDKTFENLKDYICV